MKKKICILTAAMACVVSAHAQDWTTTNRHVKAKMIACYHANVTNAAPEGGEYPWEIKLENGRDAMVFLRGVDTNKMTRAKFDASVAADGYAIMRGRKFNALNPVELTTLKAAHRNYNLIRKLQDPASRDVPFKQFIKGARNL